jgi:hypothetical protein
MTNVWDQFSAGGAYVEFNAVGDSVTGTITSITAKVWPDGKISPQLDLRQDDGTETTLTASWVYLIKALKEEAPNVGDRIKVTLTGIGPKPREVREWSVEKLDAAAPAPAAEAAPAEDPRIAAWRAAGISEADIAKLLAVS